MPAYNPGNYGIGAVKSALHQLREGDELIIQDAVSNDSWMDGLPQSPRLSIVSEPDQGQSDALNLALNRATGEYVGWLNADDIYYPGALDAVRYGMRSNADIVYGDYATITGSDDVIRAFSPPRSISRRTLISRGCCLYSGAFFVRRQKLIDAGGFSSDFTYCMDYELFLRLWSIPHITAQHVTSRLGALRIHEGTKTTSVPRLFVEEAQRARSVHVRTAGERILSSIELARHTATVLTTGVRSTQTYRAIRSRRNS